MSDKIDMIASRLEKIENKLSSIHDVQVVQHETLKEHIRRSEANEKAVELLEMKLDQELQPIKNHVVAVNSVLKVLGLIFTGIVSVLGIIFSAIEVIKLFN